MTNLIWIDTVTGTYGLPEDLVIAEISDHEAAELDQGYGDCDVFEIARTGGVPVTVTTPNGSDPLAALNEIHAILDAPGYWSADHLEWIAMVVTSAGYVISEPE